MHPKKGVLELVESWARVMKAKAKGEGEGGEKKAKSDGEQWCCELVYTVSGETEKAYEQKVKQRVLELGMTYSEGDNSTVRLHPSSSPKSPDFIFTGALDDEKKWEAYARADLFVLPTHSENFGIVVAEALWAGVPVITTKGAPWAELECSASSRFKVQSSKLEERCGWWVELPGTEAKVKGEGEGRRRRAEAKGEEKAWNALDNALREAISLPVTFDCSPSPSLPSPSPSLPSPSPSLPSPSPLAFTSLREMGARGHQLVAERYTWAAVCERIIEAYGSI